MEKFRWFLPTMHGDILLTEMSATTTSLRAFELTPTEATAMEALRERALSTKWRRKPWASASDFIAIESSVYRSKGGVTLDLAAPIAEVQKVLANALKPGRKLLSAVKFQNGEIAEVFEEAPRGAPDANEEEVSPRDVADAARIADAAAKLAADSFKASNKASQAVAAATVAAPVVGCPAPLFPEADLRASRVLSVFLDEEQQEDYLAYGKFVAVGADTGHRYMITNRERPGVMKHVSYRSLYDLDEDRPLCVHDWESPPAEEMLALLFCVTIPGRENLVRSLPPVWH